MTNTKNNLENRKLYIPQMSYEGARCMSAAFQSIGIKAEPSPDSDNRTYELARKYLSGDECLPQSITLGNFLKVTEQPDYEPEKTAFMLPTSNGPCRFGHYLPLARKIFQDRKEDVLILSPSSSNGYEDIGEQASDLVRTGWRAVVVSDILRKLLLKTRPYEINKGETDQIFAKSMEIVCDALSLTNISHSKRMNQIVKALKQVKSLFNNIAVKKTKKPLIGIVGEIFCRLNNFSNDDLIKVIESLGGEAWMSDVSEWVWYTNNEEEIRLIREGKRISLQMFGCRLRQKVMHNDELKMMSVFKDDFKGYNEPKHVTQVLEKSRPYLPREGSHGEMVMSVGRSIWYYEQGAAGVIDISPFTCMNSIVCEAVYPRLSQDLGGFPLRVFYFDGVQSHIENDLEIFMELATNYLSNKKN